MASPTLHGDTFYGALAAMAEELCLRSLAYPTQSAFRMCNDEWP